MQQNPRTRTRSETQKNLQSLQGQSRKLLTLSEQATPYLHQRNVSFWKYLVTMTDVPAGSWILDEGKREVFLVTAVSSDGTKHGMIITWVAPAGLVPDQKRIMMALSPTNQTTQTLMESKSFAIHLLQQAQANLVPVFGAKHSREVNKFEGVDHEIEDGLPILANTCGWMIGAVVSTMEAGDRVIVLADISKEQGAVEQDPLYVKDMSAKLPVGDVQDLDQKFSGDIDRDRQMRAKFYEP